VRAECYAFAMRAGRGSGQAPVASTLVQWAFRPCSSWRWDAHLSGFRQRMAGPQLMSRTVTAVPRCDARDPPICSAAPFVISPDGCVQIRPIWRLFGRRTRPHMVVIKVIVRHQDRGALRLDHLHNAAMRTSRR
jgi:hypothetical protein